MTALAPSDAASAMLEAMHAAGMSPRDPGAVHGAMLRGGLVRFACQGERNPNGWAVLHLDDRPAGAFGSWKLGISARWRAGGGAKASRQDMALIAARRAQEGAARLDRHRKAEAEARRLWQASAPANANHPYLSAKRLGAAVTGLDIGTGQSVARQAGDNLLIPMQSARGGLCNVQRIGPDGRKRFLPGGRLEGAFWCAGLTGAASIIAIGEGFATMAAVRLATGLPVVAAMSAGNLEAVALEIHACLPAACLILCADMDTGPRGNIGLEKANAAAALVPGALMARPPRPAVWPIDGKGWDFADTFKAPGGPDLIRRALGMKDDPNE